MSRATELKDRVSCRRADKKKPLTHGWIVVPSKSHPDRVYFYNTFTKCSTWENPCKENDSSSSESSSGSSSPSASFSSQTSTGQSSSYSSHKSLNTCNTRNLPVQTREKQQTEVKDSTNKNLNHSQQSRNSDIEDFDDSDLYFESDTNNKCVVFSTRSGDVHSPFGLIENSSCENAFFDEMKSNSAAEDDTKELWWHSSGRRERSGVKKSIALSDIEDSLFYTKDTEMSKDSRKTGGNWCDEDTSGGGSGVKRNGFKTPESTGNSSCKGSKSSKRRSRKSSVSSERQTKSDVSKISKQQFKRRDKTPAQTRLLKLREKTAEMLKEYELSGELDKMPGSSHGSRARNLNQNLESKASTDTFTADIDPDVSDAVVIDDYIEEMDWEPTSEELEAQSINALCELMDTNRESSSDLFSSISRSVTEVDKLSYSWILVLDTNILVSCLSFIKELRDTGFPELGYPVIYIPWRVLQELDHLKDSRIEGRYSHLSTNVRKAISYLNENFKCQHPRCIGQSFEDFKEMVDADTVAPDDEILETCLRLQKLHTGKKLTLLTNDKNLESKALVSHIDTFSKEEFQRKYFKSGTHSKKSGIVGAVDVDSFICELKSILKTFVPSMVETEMKLAFKKDWTKLAFKKPPWTLEDAFDCLLKHWRSVFFAIFPKDICIEAESLYSRLFRKEPENIEEICDIIDDSQRLLFKIKSSLIAPRPYLGELQATTTMLSNLLQEVMSRSSKISKPTHTLTSDERTNGFLLGETSRSESSTHWEKSLMENFLKEIWNSLNNFCFSLSNLTSSVTDRPNGSVMLETRMKLSQTLNGLRELMFSINKILEIPLRDINESHPVIIHLSNFLTKLLPAIESQMDVDLPKLLVVVCTETEGRSLLHGSLKDFRDFAENLSKAHQFFEGGLPSF